MCRLCLDWKKKQNKKKHLVFPACSAFGECIDTCFDRMYSKTGLVWLCFPITGGVFFKKKKDIIFVILFFFINKLLFAVYPKTRTLVFAAPVITKLVQVILAIVYISKKTVVFLVHIQYRLKRHFGKTSTLNLT